GSGNGRRTTMPWRLKRKKKPAPPAPPAEPAPAEATDAAEASGVPLDFLAQRGAGAEARQPLTEPEVRQGYVPGLGAQRQGADRAGGDRRDLGGRGWEPWRRGWR